MGLFFHLSEKERISDFLPQDLQDVSCDSNGVRERYNGLESGQTFGFLPD